MDNFFKGCPPKMEDGRFLTDFRTPSTREQYNKAINGIVRDDDWRMFLQKHADHIMDKQWNYMRTNYSCFTNACIHDYPLRTTPMMNYDELEMYNAVRLGKPVKDFPYCKNMADYRMTVTNTK